MQLTDIFNAIIIGDVQKVLTQIPSNSVRCIVTSPPYYGLRDYGTATWLGGDEHCKHEGKKRQSNTGRIKPEHKQASNDHHKDVSYGNCIKCGAIRIDDQIGLEKTPEEYIAKMVEIFRECRRILTDDGTLWLNIGDSYWGSGNAGSHTGETLNMGKKTAGYGATKGHTVQKHAIIKPKDLIGIPWMLAFALRADGWWLRQDIIWNKPNPMPESVQDRCTKSHEYIFLLTKSPKYYYDSYAVRQPLAENSISRLEQDIENQKGSSRENGNTRQERPMKAVQKNVNSMRPWPHGIVRDRLLNYDSKEKQLRPNVERGGYESESDLPAPANTANKKSVWTISTKPFTGAHFATFPEDLIVDCIRAGTSEHGKCSTCGQPWMRVVQKQNVGNDGNTNTKYDEKSAAGRLAKKRDAARQQQGQEFVDNTKTITWWPSCECHGKFITEKIIILPDDPEYDADSDENYYEVKTYMPDIPLDQHPVSPDIVLDIFGGAGTTAVVAKKLLRDFVLVELNEKYVKEIAVPRMQDVHGMFYTPKIVNP